MGAEKGDSANRCTRCTTNSGGARQRTGVRHGEVAGRTVVDRVRNRIDWYTEGDPDQPPVALSDLPRSNASRFSPGPEPAGAWREMAECYSTSGDLQRMQLGAMLKAVLDRRRKPRCSSSMAGSGRTLGFRPIVHGLRQKYRFTERWRRRTKSQYQTSRFPNGSCYAAIGGGE